MTFKDIIDETRGIIQETDPANSHITDATMTEWADACTLQLLSVINTYPQKDIASVTSLAFVDLDANLVKLSYASIDDGATGATGPSGYGNWIGPTGPTGSYPVGVTGSYVIDVGGTPTTFVFTSGVLTSVTP